MKGYACKFGAKEHVLAEEIDITTNNNNNKKESTLREQK